MRIRRGEPAWQRGEGGLETRVDEHVAGSWWIPNHEDSQADGTARMFGEGMVWLDLDADPWQDISGPQVSRDLRTVWGRTSTGTPMSLHGVRFIGGEGNPLAGQAHVRYVADRLIFGAHAAAEDEIVTSAVSMSFRGLREWLLGWTTDTTTPLPLVRPSAPPDEDGKSEPPDAWERALEVDADGTVLLASAGNRRKTVSHFRTVYEVSAELHLRSDKPLSLADWRQQWVSPLRDLVLFATREQTVLLFFRGRHPDDPVADIRVYSAPETTISPPSHSEYYQRDLLPAGIWDQDGFRDLIESWRHLHFRLGAVGTALFEVLNTSDMPPLTRLLRLASCAEGYHRVLHDAPPFDPDRHDEMVRAMLAVLPDEKATRDHYRDRLRYANSQSQRARLRWLVERAAEADDRLKGQGRPITNRLVGWRNDQTHLADALAMPTLDELLVLNAVLTYVLEANVLLDLGIGDDTRYCLAHGYVWDDPIPSWVEGHSLSRGNEQNPAP